MQNKIRPKLAYNISRLERIPELVRDVVVPQNLLKWGYVLLLGIEDLFHDHPELSKDHQEVYQRLDESVIHLKYLCLFRLKEKEIIDLMQYHFVEVFDMPDYSLWNYLAIKISSIVFFEDQDVFKDRVRRAIITNKQYLTKERPVLNNIEQPPTVANWIRDYTRAAEGESNTLSLLEYLQQSQNTRHLSNDDQYRLSVLLHLYEKLRLSSFSAEGFPESVTIRDENGHLLIFDEGHLEDISSNLEVNKIIKGLEERGVLPKEDEPAEKEELPSIVDYGAKHVPAKQPLPVLAEKSSPLTDMALVASMSKQIITQTVGELNALVKSFMNFLSRHDTLGVISALYVMSRIGVLGKSLEGATPMRRLYEDYLKESKNKALLDNFRLMPGSKDHQNRFVKVILIKKLGISNKETQEIMEKVLK